MLGVKMLCANLEGVNLTNANFEDPAGTSANLEGQACTNLKKGEKFKVYSFLKTVLKIYLILMRIRKFF